MYEKFGLAIDTVDFLGHAVALHVDDSYLNQPALMTLDKMALCADPWSGGAGGGADVEGRFLCAMRSMVRNRRLAS